MTPDPTPSLKGAVISPARLTHLQRLEAESIHILREVAAECERPVMLYSIGKDSAVMLHLAAKAFYPSKAALPAAARRYDLEVPGHVRPARQGGVRAGL
jgi:sulfate adenylyltransferase subunit 2